MQVKVGLHASTYFYLAGNHYSSILRLQRLTLLSVVVSGRFPTIFCHSFEILFLNGGGWNDNHLFKYNAAALCLMKATAKIEVICACIL